MVGSFVFLNKKMIAGAIMAVIAAFIIGIIIGYLAFSGPSSNYDSNKKSVKSARKDFKGEHDMIQEILDNINSNDLREFLKVLTAKPHIADQQRDKFLVDWIKKSWTEAGLDEVVLESYDTYLSWPNQTNPNKIYLKDRAGNIVFTSKHKEIELREGDDSPDFVHAFNGHAPAGDVEGQIIYVNYGRVEDLQELEAMGESVEGKICFARYGKIFRGNKVKLCQDRGAIGVILYTDPAEVAIQGTDPENVYPNTIFLPGSGIQRGGTRTGDRGDPLTPHWPALKGAFREKPEDIEGLPKIPVQPIGYDDARIILEKMGGKESPNAWKGKLKDISYRIGGEWLPKYEGYKVRIKTNNYFGIAESTNIIGFIHGEIEPDRYVFMSNHRDAWGYGSVDPSSGTANLMAIAKYLGDLRKKGWKPRRTIVFCSWAAEEYGYNGSYEWVYHKINKLMKGGVGLINTDICVSGPITKAQAAPSLRDIVIEGLKHASDPTSEENRSYYEFWEEWINIGKESDNHEEPKVRLLASGSDHTPFAFYAGIPSINHRFKDDNKKYKGVGQYPTYHTGYETFYLMDKLIDPGFKIHKTCTQSSIWMLLSLSDSKIIPYNLNHIPEAMEDALESFRKENITKTLNGNNASLDILEEAVDEFKSACAERMATLKDVNTDDPLSLRALNDQLMMLERVFIMPGGIPGRKSIRHAIFSPSKFNAYGSSAFPGLTDLLHDIDKLDEIEKKKRWKEIRMHISDLMIIVKSATEFLEPVQNI